MSIIQAIILGIVQGLTELLPISSSAHLKLIPWLLGWTNSGTFNTALEGSFDVALHFGTLIAVTLFFFKDWISLIKGGYNQVVKKEKSTEGRMFFYIIIATIPAGLLSVILDKVSGKICESVTGFDLEFLLIGIALFVMGIILYFVDKNSKSEVTYEKISFKQSMLIALSQAIAAAFPGVSRSGITMTTARALKINRESAAKFSFLLSTPIIAAAVLTDISKFALTEVYFWAGVISSFLVGIIVIKFLLNYLKKGSFKVFAIYRILLSIVVMYSLFFIK